MNKLPMTINYLPALVPGEKAKSVIPSGCSRFNLQLFGKGGGKGVWSFIGAVVGFWMGGPQGAIMGACLFSMIWMSRQKKDNENESSPSVQRFDRCQETMSSGGMIPLVYGKRKMAGNQTYHHTDADANTLYKHVVFCEGGINSGYGFTANGLSIPSTDGVTNTTVMAVQNTKYENAALRFENQELTFFYGDIQHTIHLVTKEEFEEAQDVSFWQWQVSVASLISYINRLGHGWEAFPVATTTKYPGDMHLDTVGGCYRNPMNFTVDAVTGGTNYTIHDGDLPENYEEVGSYADMFWVDLTCVVSNELGGNPNVEGIIEGKRIWDTRAGTIVYSTNPAMCLRDFLLNKRYGMGKWISADDLDEYSFIEAANYCDAMVEFDHGDGTTEVAKRFELNIIIDQKKSAWEWVDDILGCFQGYLTVDRGKIYLHVEKPSQVVYSFDESNLFDLKISSLSLDDSPNQYKVTFIDPKNDWKSVTCEVNDYADQQERGKIVTKNVNLEGVTSQNQALRLARFYRDYNYVSSVNITFKTGFQAMHLACGDVVRVTYKKVFVNMPVRITEIKESGDSTFEITCRPYNDSIYNDSLGSSISAYNYSEVNPVGGAPATPQNVQARQDYYVDINGGVHSTCTITWDEVKHFKSIQYSVYCTVDNDTTYQFLNSTPENKLIVNAVVGKTYTFYVSAVSGFNNISGYGKSNTLTISGKDNPPEPVTNLAVKLEGNQLVITWDESEEPDIHHYEVLVEGQGEYVDTGGAVVIPSQSDYTINNQIVLNPYIGKNKITVVAVDNARNRSDETSISYFVNLTPGGIRNLQGSAQNGYIILTWDAANNADSYKIEGASSGTVYGTYYFIPAPSTGDLTFRVYAVNEYGTGAASSVTVNVTDSNMAQPMMEVDLFDYASTYQDAEAQSTMGDISDPANRPGMYIVRVI